MAKPYTITILNGSGSGNVLNGNYAVSANVNGYLNASIDPANLVVVEGTNTYNLAIAADGTLTLHVTDDGTTGGNPIIGATFYRTNSTGDVNYGNAVTTDSNGNAVFANVPYGSTGVPTIYYKQTTSDGDHEFDSNVRSITMTTQVDTIQIANPAASLRTFNLVDKNYSGLPIDSGTIVLS